MTETFNKTIASSLLGLPKMKNIKKNPSHGSFILQNDQWLFNCYQRPYFSLIEQNRFLLNIF